MSDAYRKLQLQIARNFAHAYAERDGFPQTPDQATDAEISGIFRALDNEQNAKEKQSDSKR